MIVNGLDRLLANTQYLSHLQSLRVGALVHTASVTARFEHAIDALLRVGITPVRLFGPEHGLRGEAQMMIAVEHATDPITHLPIQSLYGDDEASLEPQRQAVEDLDLILIDIQDVGSRYYTYVATALKLCEIATEVGTQVLLLDRPNPLGRRREGPAIEPGFHSFVGELSVPNRHGLTTAELFSYAVQQGRALQYDVLAVEEWNAADLLNEADFPWALPSPNMPTLHTALVYPGGCLLEATNISEGRGTTRPFEMFGAPWINAVALQRTMQDAQLPGVHWRIASFAPTFDKFTAQNCYGLGVHVHDPTTFEPLRTYAALILAVKTLHPSEFDWRPGAYEFVEDIPAIDLLAGSTALRDIIENDGNFDDIQAWAACPEPLNTACQKAEHYA